VLAPTPAAAYALASWIFAEQMLTTGHQVDLEPAFRTLYAQLGDDPRYLRMKVVASINATVNAARLRQVDTMRWWRAEGEHTLAAYRALPEVDEFSGLLMTSRWYRSMGFLPFVTGDRELLRADLDQWLGIATELLGASDTHSAIIAADNYFPAVETAVRTHSYLGEHDEALRMVERLATEIDPVDAKTWLELGELRYKAGDVTGARDAYLRAAHLEFPYGRLSWFNAGQCHEELGEFEDAVECYRRSLEHWPTGVSPLRRIRDLHARGVLGRDSALIAAWARRQPAWGKLLQIPQPA
jgi:tetratricopeptide (TPR) repeat protein